MNGRYQQFGLWLISMTVWFMVNKLKKKLNLFIHKQTQTAYLATFLIN